MKIYAPLLVLAATATRAGQASCAEALQRYLLAQGKDDTCIITNESQRCQKKHPKQHRRHGNCHEDSKDNPGANLGQGGGKHDSDDGKRKALKVIRAQPKYTSVTLASPRELRIGATPRRSISIHAWWSQFLYLSQPRIMKITPLPVRLTSSANDDTSTQVTAFKAELPRLPSPTHKTERGPDRRLARTIRGLWRQSFHEVEDYDGDDTRLIRRAQKRNRETRSKYLDTQLTFSWSRFLFGMASLTLVVSDVPRSGLGIKFFPTIYPSPEPDVFQSFGPWFYSVQKLSRETAWNATGRVWSYKFDTTSIGLRAFAEFYQLAAFPDCVMYRSDCVGKTLNGEVIFGMLDSVVSAAAAKREKEKLNPSQRNEPTTTALRTENVFASWIWRTSQLLHYSSDILFTAENEPRSICFSFDIRPSFCHDLWINYNHSCLAGNATCKVIGLLWEHTLNRMRAIQQMYPTMQVDLTILESQEDMQICRGGFSPTGARKADVMTIIRVRDCDNSSCKTVYIDEYRYEVGFVYSEAAQWFRIVAWLRCIGQGYYYLRVMILISFCYLVSPSNEQRRSFLVRVKKAIILFVKTPIQSVIFDSPFSIFCYALAHSIDAAISYELLSKIFTTQGGVFKVKVRDMLTIGFNQMRSVWLLAAVLHVIIEATAISRRKQLWTPVDGIHGVPEFLSSGLASVTILAQYRSTSFRNTKIRSAFEIAGTSMLANVKSRQNKTHRGSGNAQLGGIWIDGKFFLCLLVLLWSISAIRKVVGRFLFWYSGKRPTEIQTRTPVPYSAGVLWSLGSMCVLWTSNYFCVDPSTLPHSTGQRETIARRTTTSIRKISKLKVNTGRHRVSSLQKVNTRLTEVMEVLPAVLMSPRDFRNIQSQMQSVHTRRDDVEATIAFINLVAMSDPMVYCYLLMRGGQDARVLPVTREPRQSPVAASKRCGERPCPEERPAAHLHSARVSITSIGSHPLRVVVKA
ncbi:hypothetical protein FI667_g9621, partial [Globisporangium splendens]